jgi:hypothetical protein
LSFSCSCIERVRGLISEGVLILSFSWLFCLLALLHGVLDLNFKLCAFIVNGLIKGEIENPSGQLLSLIVMSH